MITNYSHNFAKGMLFVGVPDIVMHFIAVVIMVQKQAIVSAIRKKNLLIIKDTGGGAPPEVVSNFFKGYFTTKKNGTGIGLAFCKKTMKTFGGDLICNSVYGDTMEFILSFPKIDTHEF